MFTPLAVDLLLVVVVLGNGLIFYARATTIRNKDHERGREAVRLALGFMRWLSIPFLLSLIGDTFGLGGISKPQPTAGDRPRWFDYVEIAAYLGIVARGTWWVFTQGGAAALARHRDVFGPVPSSALGVKIWWAVISGVAVTTAVGHLLTG